jgi:Mce-associated membrane protein
LPPSRRKPAATPPARRPRVAGLRKPGAQGHPDAVEEHPEDAAERTEQLPAYTESSGRDTAEESEQVDALTGEPETTKRGRRPRPVAGPRPNPRSKKRDAGTRKPDREDDELGESADLAADEDDQEPDSPALTRRKQLRKAGVLAAVGVLLTGFAVFAKLQQGDLSSATSNQALLDMAKTAQVNQDVSAAVETLFSYDFNNIPKTENAAKDLLLTDTVRNKYNQEFAEVKRLAPQQKMVVTCKVTRSAVILLDGDMARVLVFVDQTSIRTDQNQKSAGGSQLSVTAKQVDGKWKVSDMDAYNDGQAPIGQAPGAAPGGQAPPPSK